MTPIVPNNILDTIHRQIMDRQQTIHMLVIYTKCVLSRSLAASCNDHISVRKINKSSN